ncbi:palmitoyltransferase ZDHHC19 isoform X1 [Leopardus geoffroyi]|uniref:palmitoyltransferase ZDHHC19 isoform X1 n=1 Tax=Leopardus geoffroyi TaxID=46844 RepID=UPI001E25F726|nr:palmitoyltransferase ZDHHC19 isoform X1 [Leopardus geoffroyi]
MPVLKDAMPLMKEPHPLPQAPLPWILPSLFAAFNVVLLVVFSGLFFAFPCRWLAQNGEWAFPLVTGLLCVLTFFSLVSLNFSDPGILHQGSNEQGPMMVHVVWVNQRAFRLQWCQKCCFHRPPRTYHCPWCNVCVEDFDHHCKWVNNCIGHRNFRFFMLLVLSLCLYSGALLVTCLIFLVRTTHLPFSMDKAMAILVTVPAAGFLVPLFLLLLIQAMSVSAAQRSCEGKCRYLQGYNPFDHGCASNWYLTICAPLGPKYMAEAVWLQRVAGSDWVPMQNLHFPVCPSVLSTPALPEPGSGPQPQPLSLHKPGKGPSGRGSSPPGGVPQTRLCPPLAPSHPAMPGGPASEPHLLSPVWRPVYAPPLPTSLVGVSRSSTKAY